MLNIRGMVRVAICAAAFASALVARVSLAQASLSGSVLVESPERPLAGAEILIQSQNLSARSDSLGQFRIKGIAAGKVVVLVRLPGYDAVRTTLTFRDAAELEADFVLVPTATALAPVDVRAQQTATSPWAIRLSEFEERRALKVGRYLTEADIEKQNGRPISSFLAATIFPGYHRL